MSSRSQLHLDELPRSSGHAALSVEVVDGMSSVISLRAHSPMKLLSPISRGKSVWACTSSFGGGMVAGDETVLDLRLGEGARCHVSSQASTKIYRNPSGLPCSHRTHASLGPGSFLSFVPDPVQAFAGARYAQAQEFELGEGAGLVLVDWFGSGRAACGERWAFQHYSSRTKILVSQEPRFVDALYLEGADGPLEGQHRLGRFNSLATVVLLGELLSGDSARILEEIGSRPVGRLGDQVASASPIQGGCVVRLAATQVEELVREVRSLLKFLPSLLGDDPWIRKW